MRYKQALAFARENRKKQTPAEKRFWSKARNRQMFGLKFNRQFIIEYKVLETTKHYLIADFYCHELNLIIEIDGPIHEVLVRNDEERERTLRSMGFAIQRFTNDQVLNNWNEVDLFFENTIGTHL